jgi:hypothetical protein
MSVGISETRYGVVYVGLVRFLWGATARYALHKIQLGACQE